jgi:VWFA-related protein
MVSLSLRLGFLLICLVFCAAVVAQTPRRTQKPPPLPTPTPETSVDPGKPPESQDIETLKTDTNLVSVPVIATDANGTYVSDLTQQEFAITEDGQPQQVAFFGKVAQPFHVVLMLDTSASTEDKLKVIQQAANAFVDQLQPADRVKVISFDDEVKDRNEFTSNRTVLKAAINSTRPGKGTKVYDAFELALSNVRRIQGRKAIVLFTDGVDWHSDSATYEGTVRGLDEEGVIVYPIRYDTREFTEQLAREQAQESTPSLPTLDVIRRQSRGTTAPTFPSDEPGSNPSVNERRTGPMGLPMPDDIFRRRPQTDPRNDPSRDPNRVPSPDNLPPTTRSTLPPIETGPTRPKTKSDDSISAMLDLAYSTADGYLETLATKSGGRLLRADTLTSLPDAFAKIAAELRTQYLLGYYPTNKATDDRYRRIKVTVSRKNVHVRSRPGYQSTSGR